MKYNLLSLVVLVLFLGMAPAELFAQGTVRGKVVDATTKEPLPGATVILKGTNQAVPTSADGTFSMKVDDASATAILVNYVGYVQKEVSVAGINGTKDVGTVALAANANSLNEVLITANSYAIDRQTPVAMSSITSEVIVEKGAQQEFPELLKSTPGVYATKGTGGGYGDSRINLRGFQSANIAVMINGIPVNDMENGRVYWSNWAGLNDVTKSMQVQRGLGASKVAVPSIGGTINIITKTTDATKGGFISQGIGNNGFSKTAFSLSTGLTENGWAVSFAGSKTEGEGWFEGLGFEAYSYFFNVSKQINSKHTLSLTGFGAPQEHGSRFERKGIQYYRDAPQGRRFTPNWGIHNGEARTISGNYYHKPQVSLNHYWNINETSFLSTALYGSMGIGGNAYPNNSTLFLGTRTGGEYSPVDIDAIVDMNVEAQDGRALAYIQSNRNEHKWVGALSTYQKSISEKFDLLAGLDLRYYQGMHYNSVRDLLGAEYVLDNGDVNNPNKRAKNGDKIGFNNDGIVNWQGGFLQGEYKSGPLAAFVSLAASNTSYQRIDYFRYKNDDPLRESDVVNFLGYQTKGGANYNLTDNHNIFANVGYFEKAPFFNAVFINNQNIANKDAQNEKILSYELGYGYRASNLSANVNLYRTTWKDRSFTRRIPGQNVNEPLFANLLGVDALHQGVEIDFRYEPVRAITLTGMVSLGDWTWLNNLDEVSVIDPQTEKVVETIGPITMAGLKVGDAPQTTAAIGLDVRVIEGLKLGVDYNYFANFNSEFNPINLPQNRETDPWMVPNYSLFDLNAVYKFKVAGLNASLIGNVNNLFDTEYISDALANYEKRNPNADNSPQFSNASNAFVYFGTGRTWTTTLRINF
ncbi:outer membrane receptor protein involved in Fe transport [Pontibacter aydingkolensis]|uniref:TonB-dependent receptor n=1 Tax=Pontibacter aydingkolensis TaxID=1911536 RepID=A0ABS7CRG3_9BACT|nr:TonB-dependent receptor [Pontibacter aydingkolensis]MBW7466442.1 TonB-dependent receptor [Pontibacter aydingkolensis]